jgi:hypothetical protein
MARRPIFNDFQVKEMKEIIRTGEPIMMLAEKLATKYGVSESSMRSKLYSIARRTYKIAEWNGPKRRTKKNMTNESTISESITTMEQPTQLTGKKVVMYEDHIRIYF